MAMARINNLVSSIYKLRGVVVSCGRRVTLSSGIGIGTGL
jgi:hypothetical protein